MSQKKSKVLAPQFWTEITQKKGVPWERQKIVKWAKESSSKAELLARIKKETGWTVTHDALTKRLCLARLAGIPIPDLRFLFGAGQVQIERESEAGPSDLELRATLGNTKLRRQGTKIISLERQLAEANERARFWQEAKGAQEVHIKPLRKSSKTLREGTPILMASDWHVEEVVEPAKVNHCNEYNPDIARKRAERFFQGCIFKIKQVQSAYTCDQALLWAGGDFITGFIHESYKEVNAMTPIQAIRFWKGLFKAGIEMILEELPELQMLHVVCNYGNHGRTTLKPSDGAIAAANSYEHGAYWDLAEILSGEKRVKFQIAESTLEYVNLYDWTVRFTHGDKGVKFQDAIGGISTAARKAVMGWDTSRPADYTVMGHWHQFLTPFNDIIVNGSLIGYNSYAIDIKARYEPPQQGFWMLDAERGRRHTESVWVSDYGARKPR